LHPGSVELFGTAEVRSIGELKGGPLATKRALRAIPKAVDSYAREPEQMAQFLVDHACTEQDDSMLQAMQQMVMAYSRWCEYDPPR
jgi:hypothetical protein